MIKFFRHIRQNLLSEGKTGKYLKYAIGEIVLVVIGILIALQINNWNEQRKERKLEVIYIDRILDDLEEEETFLQSYIDYNMKVNKYAIKAISYFENPEIAMENPNQGLIDLYQASQYMDARATASTYKELNASGQINILRNQKLRLSLINFYELDWINSGVIDLPNKYRESLRSFMPSDIQKKIRTNCGDIYVETKNSLSVKLPDNCEIDIESKVAKMTLEKLLKNGTIRNDLNFLIGNMENKLVLANYTQKQLKTVLEEFYNAKQ
jgi:hypothetical protein